MAKRFPITSGLENEILRTKSEAIDVKTIRKDKKLQTLIEDMKLTMEEEEGIGIAAPQVGINIRLELTKLNPGTPNETTLVMINPEITSRSEDMNTHEEGCLSLRGYWGPVTRHTGLTVKFYNEKGNLRTLHLEGLNARIVQHEIDHLDGMLFWDHVREGEGKMEK